MQGRLIRERQLEGIAIAKTKGVYKGRKKSLNSEQVEKMKMLIEQGVTKTRVAKELGVSRETLYKYFKEIINID